MKHLITLLCLALAPCTRASELGDMIDSALARAEAQALHLAEDAANLKGLVPRTFDGGKLCAYDYEDWVCGFFPGTLWLLYQNHPSPELLRWAEDYTARVESAKDLTTTHDLGFMLYCSYGQGYRITHRDDYLRVMADGARSLAARFVPQVGVIRSWDAFPKWQCPVIIDNMMNLEFLIEMARLADEPAWEDIAISHANTTLRHHFRPDASSYHVVSYDTITGLPHAKQTHQGYADHSAWARGQGWAVYGYTMMYRLTGRPEYLAHARQVAHFITTHPRMPQDLVPYWDFDDPRQPLTPRDAAAAAVIASGLIELSQLDTEDGPHWLQYATQQLRSLCSPDYLAAEDTNGHFVLMHSVGNMNKNSEVDVPLAYADYYFVEALLRLKALINN